MQIDFPDKCFTDEELVNTPKRFKKFLGEWIDDCEEFKFTTFENPNYDEMIVVKDIQFYSMCSHHLIPFFGKAHIAYVPDRKIVGLSKLARAVDKFAHKPQVQERLTKEIADFLDDQLAPKGLMVVVEAEHMCMSMRGIKKPGHKTITSALKGEFKTNGRKHEFIEMLKL